MSSDYDNAVAGAKEYRRQQAWAEEVQRKHEERDQEEHDEWVEWYANHPPNRYVRRHLERSKQRELLNRKIIAQMGCAWPGCQATRAYFAGLDLQTRRPQFNPIYKDSPLCTEHLYEAWRIARDAADALAVMHHRLEVEEALSLNAAARELRREQRPLRPDSAITGTVYYLRCDGYIKIGYATVLADRIKQYPPSACLLAVRPGNLYEEQREHQLLRSHLAYRREWYHPAPEVMQRIAQVTAQYGPLPEVEKVQKRYVEERPRVPRVR